MQIVLKIFLKIGFRKHSKNFKKSNRMTTKIQKEEMEIVKALNKRTGKIECTNVLSGSTVPIIALD